MNHGKIRTGMLLLLAAVLVVPMTACDGDSPKRRGPQSYVEYREANDPFFPEGRRRDDGGGEDNTNGDFGPAAPVTVTSADAILAGNVPNSGSLKGQIKYAGKTAKRKVINTSKTPYCVESGQVLTEDLIVSDKGGLKNVVVYIKKGFIGTKFEPYSKGLLVNQLGCKYVPHVVACMANQELLIKNSDATSHNYHFTGKANPEINKTQPNQNQVDPEFLGNSELNAVFACDIHPWMRAAVYVMDHPYYAVTDDEGNFEIKGLPAGKYQIAFEHERADMTCAVQEVTITAGQASAINAEFRR